VADDWTRNAISTGVDVVKRGFYVPEVLVNERSERAQVVAADFEPDSMARILTEAPEARLVRWARPSSRRVRCIGVAAPTVGFASASYRTSARLATRAASGGVTMRPSLQAKGQASSKNSLIPGRESGLQVAVYHHGDQYCRRRCRVADGKKAQGTPETPVLSVSAGTRS